MEVTATSEKTPHMLAAADDVEVVANGTDAVPKAALGVGNVLDEGQKLDYADKGGHEHSDAAEDDLVVQQGDEVPGKSLGAVERHHGGAVGGINQAHASYVVLALVLPVSGAQGPDIKA